MTTLPLGRLLIVDTEAELVRNLCRVLADYGYQAVGCTSGKEALEALRDQSFHLLLTDLAIPDMDGITLLQAGLEIDPRLVGIIMTEDCTVQSAVRAMKAGAFDYVMKPCDATTLLPVLSRSMEMCRLREQNIQLRETVAIYELIMALAYTMDMSTLLNKIADATIQQLDADELSIMLPTHDGKELYVAAVRGEHRQHILGQRVPTEEGIAGWVACHREPITLHGEINDPRFESLRPRNEISSSISMPLMSGNKLIGVLNVSTTRPHHSFRLGQVKALSILTSAAAAAIESARLYTQVLEAEEKYRSIFENSVEGIFRSDPNGRFLAANPALARMLGYESPAELMAGVTDIERQLFARPEQHAAFRRLLLRHGVVSGFQSQVNRKDGSTIWISTNVRAIRDPLGAILCIEGTVEDCTKRKRAEEAQRRLAAILEATPDMVVTFDFDGNIFYLNRAGRRILGFGEKEDLSGVQFVDFFTNSAGQHILGEYLPTVFSDGIWRGELEISSREGRQIPVSLVGIAHKTPDGALAYFSAVARDITELKGIESQLREYSEKLETKVKARTVEIEKVNRELEELNRELLARKVEADEATQQAESANRAKSDFLANMSHELRTPLNSIIGFSEVLADQLFGPLNEKQYRYVQNICTSGKHLLGLINDILDLSKVESGKMELELDRFHLKHTCTTAINMLKEKALKHNIALVCEIRPDADTQIDADERKIKQILFNLLSNALKFTPDGGAVHLKCGMRSRGCGKLTNAQSEHDTLPIPYLEVSVSDTGIGIKPEDQERIFQEFVQVDSSYGRKQQGTGLGLSLTRKLVGLHGGRIWVESEGEGKGSTFTFIVPIRPSVPVPSLLLETGDWARDENSPPRALTCPATCSTPEDTAIYVTQPSAGRPLILVIEDDRQASWLLCHYLWEAGYAVAQAFDGEEAIRKAREMVPFAITLDILLPGTNGWEVLGKLKSIPETRDIPVIVVTVTDNQSLGVALGIVDFFVKPVCKEQLIEALNKIKAGCRKENLRALVVDDDPKIVELLTDMLQGEGFTILKAYGGRQGVDLAINELPDIIILDLMMPQVTGFEVVEQLREHLATKDIPILIFTAKELTAEDRQKLGSGAQGIISKAGGKDRVLRELDMLKKKRFV